VSIGEALAQARHQAGLTVAQVSQQTNIREAIIRGIEADDYLACGGDFYARGHIRGIARVVGADPEPLIREYDTTRRPQPITAADVFEPVTPIRIRERRRLSWTAALVLGLIAALGFAVYHLLPGSLRPGSRHAPAAAAAHVAAHPGAARGRPSPVPDTRPAAAGPYADKAVVQLTAIRDCWVEFTSPGGRYLFGSYIAAGASKSWTFRRPVDMRLASRGGIRLTVDGRNPLPAGPAARPITLSLGPNRRATATATSRVIVRTRTLHPVSAAAFGPYGAGQGDSPQLAHLAIDGNTGTAWHTDWYTTARFGNLYRGTGLLLDMGHPVTITGARIGLGSARGADFQLRVGTAPSLADLPSVARSYGAGGEVSLRLTSPAHGRYVLIWFTRLPPDQAGAFEASVHGLRLAGPA